MRIVVASPPKSGNHWIKCLLGQVYDLDWLGGGVKPDIRPAAFREWIAQGGFPDQTIFHIHARYSPRLTNAIEAAPASVVTIVRDPYDAFVSMYYWLQTRATHDEAAGKVRSKVRPRDALIGKPLDHPDVLAFLADRFGQTIANANGWLQSGRSVIVRYEHLHRDPAAELTRATEQLRSVPPERIAQAIEACRADNMRQMSDRMQWHVRAAKVGDSREQLGEAHLAIFRERHADQIRALGYEVR